MRSGIALLAAVTTGGLSLAFADPPNTPPISPVSTGTAASGEGKSASCLSCHGPNGNSTNPESPRLAGQSAVYLAGQLRLFRSGVRNDSVMKPLAATLSDQDINDLAVYYEAQTPAAALTPAAAPAKPAPGAADQRKTAAGERKTEQLLRLQGYKLSMVRGDEVYCRREAPLGSRLESVMHCVTVAEAEAMAREGRETTERLQQRTPGCLQPAAGGCGH